MIYLHLAIFFLVLVASSQGSPENIDEVIDASEILEKIKNGQKVEYQNQIIEGDLVLNKEDLGKNDDGKFLVVPFQLVDVLW